MGNNYCAVENIQIIAEGELFNVYTSGALTVLYNHHYITVCNATEMLITVFTIASYSFLSWATLTFWSRNYTLKFLHTL